MTLCALDLGSTLFRPCARLKFSTLSTGTPSPTKPQPFSITLSPSVPQIQRSHRTASWPSTNYWFYPFLLTPPPVCSSTCPSSYFQLPVTQSECLRVTGNYPRRTPISHLHDTLNVEPIPLIIHGLNSQIFFAHGPSHPNPCSKKSGIVL